MDGIARQLTEKLIENLTNQKAGYENMLHSVSKKCGAIMSADVETLNEIVRKENAFIRLSTELEKERVQLLEQLFNDGKITISEVIERVEDGYAAQLMLLQSQLLEAVDQFKKHSEKAREMLNQSLDYTKTCLEVISDTLRNTGMYGQGQSSSFSVWDRKA